MKKSIHSNQGSLPADKQEARATRRHIAKQIIQDIRVVVRTVQAHSRWIEKQCGVSSVQLWAMWELYAQPGQKVSDLSRALSIHQSTASNMLDKLEEKTLIRRDRSGPDQRVVRLFLTSEGSNVLSKAPRPAQGAVQDALHKMSDEELHSLKNSLDTLIDHMSVSEHDAGLNPI